MNIYAPLLILIIGGFMIIKFLSWRFARECEGALKDIKQETEQKCKDILEKLE